ncbi:MAG TPA: hypothetical protein VN754_09715, partial [Candidatus Binataceae bacterium]|nr:hypothetical protein [Candidatus Binataceae bacterium]
LEYFFFGSLGETTGAQLRKKISQAGRRLYEVAVIVHSAYQKAVDVSDEEEETGTRRRLRAGCGRRYGLALAVILPQDWISSAKSC